MTDATQAFRTKENEIAMATKRTEHSESPENKLVRQPKIHQSLEKPINLISTMEIGKYASCRYHWKKSLPVKDNKNVLLFVNYGQDKGGIIKVDLLAKNSHFYSTEIQVPCGAFSGILWVSQVDYQLEPIHIKSYMFEIDLYIKDEPSYESITTKEMLSRGNSPDQYLDKYLKFQKMSAKQDDRVHIPATQIFIENTPILNVKKKVNQSIDKQSGFDGDLIQINEDSTFNDQTVSNCVVSDVIESKLPLRHKAWIENTNASLENVMYHCESSNHPNIKNIESEEKEEDSHRLENASSLHNIPTVQEKDLLPDDKTFTYSSEGSNAKDNKPWQNDSYKSNYIMDWEVVDKPVCSENEKLINSNKEFTSDKSHFAQHESGLTTNVSAECHDTQQREKQSPLERLNDHLLLQQKQQPPMPQLAPNGLTPQQLEHLKQTHSKNESNTLSICERKNPLSPYKLPGNAVNLTEVNNKDKDNNDLARKVDMLQKMNESLQSELTYLRSSVPDIVSKTHLSWLQTRTSLQEEKCVDSLVKHLKEEKQSLQDEVMKLKEELFHYRHLAKNNPNGSINPDASAYGDNLALHLQIAELQKQVIHLQDINAATSGQLKKALWHINVLQSDKEIKATMEKPRDEKSYLGKMDDTINYKFDLNQDSSDKTRSEKTIKDQQNIPEIKKQQENIPPCSDYKSYSQTKVVDTGILDIQSPSIASSRTINRSENMKQDDLVNRKREAQHGDFNNIELVNNSCITNVSSFLPSRQTSWDQYNQVKLNENSIRKLQQSLDAQHHMHQSFLENYKPSSNNPPNSPIIFDHPKSSKTGFKHGTSDSTSCLLAAPVLGLLTNSVDSQSQDIREDSPEFSDTATDVLLNITPPDQTLFPSLQSPPNTTVNDDAINKFKTYSSFGYEIPGVIDSKNQSISSRRCQSAEPGDSTGALNRSLKPHCSRPTKSNHQIRLKKLENKILSVKPVIGSESSKRQWAVTQGKRPYVPQSPDDIQLGDFVKFSKYSGKISQGIVKYVGLIEGHMETFLGVELHKDEGRHDGVFRDTRYFKCARNRGVFVSFNKVVMAWVSV